MVKMMMMTMAVFVSILAPLSVWYIGASAHCCSSFGYPTLTPGTEGQILVQHTYRTVRARQLSVCASRCLRQRHCKSFNFDNKMGICALNNRTRATAMADFIVTANTDVVYYDVTEWQESLLGGCADHVCEDLEACAPGYLGPNKSTYICLESYTSDVITPDIAYSDCSVSTSCTDCIPVREINGRKFGPVGCYHSKHSDTLSTPVENLRGNIDWHNMSAIIAACAQLTTGFQLFGIEFYGECYGGWETEADYSGGLVDVTSCQTDCWGDVGAADVMMVYKWLTDV